MEKYRVAIVILNFNGRQYLEKFLPCVIGNNYSEAKIYVADNASTDDSVTFLKSNFPEISRIQLTLNTGYAGGYNNALKDLKEDFFVLLNSDIEVTPNWIEPVIKMMENNLEIAACQPKILSFKNPDTFEYAGAAGGWIDMLGYPFARGRIFDTCEKDEGQYDDPSEVFWASGAALFIRREVFEKLGGFHEAFFAHMEEIELCWRIHETGLKISYCPESVVYHVGGGTLPQGNSRKVFLNFRNNLWMLSMHLPFSEKIWIFPTRFMLDLLYVLKSLLSGRSGDAGAVMRAWMIIIFSPLPGKKMIKNKRRNIRKYPGVYQGLLAWAYYVEGKKYFSKIIKKNLDIKA
ncbi:MAG: glycosyltransferase family 2 protein [Bacteroidetes bacterium]|nr:glycosyltransferase family 2 protein [Bacteroidota bacterium]